MEKGYLKEILRSTKTVYSTKDITRMWWPRSDAKNIKSRINYYVKQGDLYPIRRGLYAKDKNYDRLELASKIFTPSYVSFETVLFNASIIFQRPQSIFIASYQSKSLICDGQTYVFRKIKNSILRQPLGIETDGNYSIATPERAFLDMLYLNKDYYVDNPGSLNWNRVLAILPIYHNKRMEKIVKDMPHGS